MTETIIDVGQRHIRDINQDMQAAAARGEAMRVISAGAAALRERAAGARARSSAAGSHSPLTSS